MSETITKPLFSLELSPTARQQGVAYVHDVELDDGQELHPGDRVEIRDEGGAFFAATVEAVEPARFGNKYRLHIQP